MTIPDFCDVSRNQFSTWCCWPVHHFLDKEAILASHNLEKNRELDTMNLHKLS